MSIVRTRFSPSPTGMIHLGNVRAALFSALYASKNAGVFILRIEDTDVARSEERYVDSLQNDLLWIGIDWQEGPNRLGKFGPYWQSQRQAIYAKYYQILEDQKLIYPCFCTDAELNIARKRQLAKSQAPRYSGTCRHLSQDQIDTQLARGLKPAWRFAIPANQTIAFIDSVKGPQSFQSNDLGDFIVRRADGTPPFLFCNAIDDATMQVSHVLRGEDHLANTPRQIMILEALKLTPPSYGHLSLIVGEDGAPLSKRHGSFSLEQIRSKGYLPAAILNYLARLGHVTDLSDLTTFEHLASHFELNKLGRSAARFDEAQLLYWQKLAVQALSPDQFWVWLGEELTAGVPLIQRDLLVAALKTTTIFPPDAKTWIHMFITDELTYDQAAQEILKAAGPKFFEVTKTAVQQFGIDLPKIFAALKEVLNVQGKKLFMPLRIALSGTSHGPELSLITEILGQEKMLARIEAAGQIAAQ